MPDSSGEVDLSRLDGLSVTNEEAKAWSDNVRSLRPNVSALDIQRLADQTGVSPITVRRWFSSGTVQQDIIPHNIIGKPWTELNEGQRLRLFAAKALAEGVVKEPAIPGDLAAFKERYGSISTATRQLANYLSGEADPYLNRQVTRLNAVFDTATGQWQLVAIYSRAYEADMMDDDFNADLAWEQEFVGAEPDIFDDIPFE